MFFKFINNIFAKPNKIYLKPIRFFLNTNESLKHSVFRKYLIYRFALILALNMQSTIISYFVYKITKDKLALGMLGLWEVIPAIGCSLFSGHFVDISEKKGLILKFLIGYLLLSIFFIFLSYPSIVVNWNVHYIVWLIYFGIFIGGALRAFISPASFALMGTLVPRSLYANATTWSSTAWQTGAVIGPLLGGFMIAITGFNVSLISVFVIELISLTALFLIPKQAILKQVKEPILKSLGEGLKFVFKTQLVLAALSLDMFAVLFGGAVALLPVYADDILNVGELGFGWLRAAPAIGSVITLVLLSFIPLKTNPGLKLFLCFAGFGITTITFGYCDVLGGTQALFTLGGLRISFGFIIAITMLLAGGMLDAISVVVRGIILQTYTPDKMRGRVAAVNTMFISSSNELGAMESGITAKWMGTQNAVVFGGIMTLVVVSITWFMAPKLRHFKLEEDKEG